MEFGALASPMAPGTVDTLAAEGLAPPPSLLRVLAVIPDDGQGASFIFARRQVDSLAKLGISVSTFYLQSRTAPLAVWREGLRLKKIISELAPDLVHAHYGTVTSCLSAIAAKSPLVITLRGSDLNAVPDIGFLRAQLGVLLSQLSALRAQTIICTSEKLKARLWWQRDRVVVVPSGVNLDLFKPIDQKQARKQLSFCMSEKIVLFNASKNPLLKGLSLAKQAVETAERLVGKIRFIQLDGTVPPETIPLYMNAADCLVLASKTEGSPNVVKEAIACNLPIVSVDVGDVVQLLQGVSLCQVVSRDSTAMGKAIAEILKVRRRSNGRAKVHIYSEENIALRILKLYQSTRPRQHRALCGGVRELLRRYR